MQQPKVSVITACYNGARFIDDWADSLLRQTWDNVEIFFVNDGSTDGTGSIAHSYAVRSSKRAASPSTTRGRKTRASGPRRTSACAR